MNIPSPAENRQRGSSLSCVTGLRCGGAAMPRVAFSPEATDSRMAAAGSSSTSYEYHPSSSTFAPNSVLTRPVSRHHSCSLPSVGTRKMPEMLSFVRFTSR